MKNKGQISLEFVLLIGILIAIFSVYLPVFWEQIQGIREEREFLEARKVGFILKREIELASLYGEGYSRNFTLPRLILNENYTIKIYNESRLVRIRWDEKVILEKALARKIVNEPKPGKNKIYNKNESVYFQSLTN